MLCHGTEGFAERAVRYTMEVTDRSRSCHLGSAEGMTTMANFWRVVQYAIDNNGRTLRLCLVLVILAVVGIAWHG
jgi:hypothetical protein